MLSNHSCNLTAHLQTGCAWMNACIRTHTHTHTCTYVRTCARRKYEEATSAQVHILTVHTMTTITSVIDIIVIHRVG